eukprot:m.105558 g.105558  ORF g.105558 m.105558 type:complete len:440 (+) comp15121_c5_seq1:305-1624(+)
MSDPWQSKSSASTDMQATNFAASQQSTNAMQPLDRRPMIDISNVSHHSNQQNTVSSTPVSLTSASLRHASRASFREGDARSTAQQLPQLALPLHGTHFLQTPLFGTDFQSNAANPLPPLGVATSRPQHVAGHGYSQGEVRQRPFQPQEGQSFQPQQHQDQGLQHALSQGDDTFEVEHIGVMTGSSISAKRRLAPSDENMPSKRFPNQPQETARAGTRPPPCSALSAEPVRHRLTSVEHSLGSARGHFSTQTASHDSPEQQVHALGHDVHHAAADVTQFANHLLSYPSIRNMVSSVLQLNTLRRAHLNPEQALHGRPPTAVHHADREVRPGMAQGPPITPPPLTLENFKNLTPQEKNAYMRAHMHGPFQDILHEKVLSCASYCPGRGKYWFTEDFLSNFVPRNNRLPTQLLQDLAIEERERYRAKMRKRAQRERERAAQA